MKNHITEKLQPTFPYDFEMLKDSNGGFDLIKASALGNEMVTEFSLKCLEEEGLGKDEFCDFLSVSYSSTDYVGHQFAPSAIETQDTYLRLDSSISILLSQLDQKVGFGNYTVFLTADHGAVHNPNYLKKLGLPAGYFNTDRVKSLLDTALFEEYGINGIIENYSNNQIFLNDSIVHANKMDKPNLKM